MAIHSLFVWVMPLYTDGKQVDIVDNIINIGFRVAKRFMVGADDESAILFAQPNEMTWIRNMPWHYAGADHGGKRIYLAIKPARPMREIFITIPVDNERKIQAWKKRNKLRILEFEVGKPIDFRRPSSIVIPLQNIDSSARNIKSELRASSDF